MLCICATCSRLGKILLGDYLLTSYLLLWGLSGGGGGGGEGAAHGELSLVGNIVSAPGGVDLERRLVSCIVTYCSRPAAYQGCWGRHRMFPEERESKSSPKYYHVTSFSCHHVSILNQSLRLILTFKCSSVNINFAEPENLLTIDCCPWPLARFCCVSLRINRKNLTPATWYLPCLWVFSHFLVLILFPSELIFHFIFWSLLNWVVLQTEKHSF